jgi:hypothetical protein
MRDMLHSLSLYNQRTNNIGVKVPILESPDRIDVQEPKQTHSEATNQSPLNTAQVHDEALEALYYNIWHQGTTGRDAASAVRLLIERLQDDSIQDKDELLLLLAYIARGNSYMDIQQHLAYGAVERERRDIERFVQEGDCTQNVYEAVREGVEVYLDLLKHGEGAIRTCAAYTLACFKEYAAAIIPVLHVYIAAEEDELARSSMLLSLGALTAQYDLTSRQLLLEMLKGEASDLVKLAAALALARLDRHDTPPEAIRVLVDTLIETEPSAELYLELPWADSGIVEDISHVIYDLGPCAASIAIPMLIEALGTATAHSSLRIVDALLHLAFNGERISTDITSPTLTSEQRLVLTTIANSSSAWVIKIINKGQVLNERQAA